MPNGSNRYTKQQVQAGALCYVCETATPARIDAIGGPICTDCFTHMQSVILRHVLTSGYHKSTRKVE